MPVCGFVKANSENAQEDSTSTAAAASMLKSAGILRNGIQESNVRILKNEIQNQEGNESDDWILKCSKKKKKGATVTFEDSQDKTKPPARKRPAKEPTANSKFATDLQALEKKRKKKIGEKP